MSGEIHKGRYIYYRCTGYKGNCGQPMYREEAITEMLMDQCLKPIRVDETVLGWIKTSLKDSHVDKQVFLEEQIAKLQTEYKILQDRLEQMYVDKLDGKVSGEFYEHKLKQWQAEQNEITRKIQDFQSANRNYIDKGILLLEAAAHAYEHAKVRNTHEKRLLLDFVLSNCRILDGKAIPEYRELFGMIADANAKALKEKRDSRRNLAKSPVWGG